MADKQQSPFYISQLFSGRQKPDRDRKVQMNPRTAILRSEARVKMQQIAGLTAIIFIFAGMWMLSYISAPPTDIKATFNFRRSFAGTILSVDSVHDSVTVAYQSSTDPTIINTGIKQWTVSLIPGKSVINSKTADRACYLINNLAADLTSAVGSDCNRVITVGRLVLMDYVFLNIQKHQIVVRSIIGKN